MVLGHDPLRPTWEDIKMLGAELDEKTAEIKRLRAVLEEIKAGRSRDPQWDAICALKDSQ